MHRGRLPMKGRMKAVIGELSTFARPLPPDLGVVELERALAAVARWLVVVALPPEFAASLFPLDRHSVGAAAPM